MRNKRKTNKDDKENGKINKKKINQVKEKRRIKEDDNKTVMKVNENKK